MEVLLRSSLRLNPQSQTGSQKGNVSPPPKKKKGNIFPQTKKKKEEFGDPNEPTGQEKGWGVVGTPQADEELPAPTLGQLRSW